MTNGIGRRIGESFDTIAAGIGLFGVVFVILAVILYMASDDIFAAGATNTADIVVPTQKYQLDTGDMVYQFVLDEGGVVCFAMNLGGRSTDDSGIACIGLTDSIYSWPIIEPDNDKNSP